MKECSRRAWSSRRDDWGIGDGPRKGDSEISEDPDCCPDKNRRLESLCAIGDKGVVDDEAPEKSSERLAASLCGHVTSWANTRSGKATDLILHLLKLCTQFSVILAELLHTPEYKGKPLLSHGKESSLRRNTHIMAFSCFALMISRFAIES